MLEQLTTLPFFVSLLAVSAVLFFVYTLLGLFAVRSLNRILSLIPVLLLLSVLYMQGSPLLATLLLSIGFLLSFLLAFTLLAGPRN